MDDLSKLLRQMGAEEGGKENIKGHAERLWKFLDDLAEDPQEYQNFQEAGRSGGVGGESPGRPAAGTRAPAEDPEVIGGRGGGHHGEVQAGTIALLISEGSGATTSAGRSETSCSAPGEVYALRREPRRERAARGLPKIEGGYVVVEVSMPRAILAAARRLSAASSGPETSMCWWRAPRRGSGDAWPAARPGEEEDACQGAEGPEQGGRARHPASELPESVLSKIAGLAGGRSPARGGRPAGRQGAQEAAIQEILRGEAAKSAVLA